jgi:hypothetical protein
MRARPCASVEASFADSDTAGFALQSREIVPDEWGKERTTPGFGTHPTPDV